MVIIFCSFFSTVGQKRKSEVAESTPGKKVKTDDEPEVVEETKEATPVS